MRIRFKNTFRTHAAKLFIVLLLVFVNPLQANTSSSFNSNEVVETGVLAEVQKDKSNKKGFLDKHVITLFSEKEAIILAGNWQYFVNEGNYSVEEVIHNPEVLKWNTEYRKNASYSYDEREYWFRFRLRGSNEFPETFIIDIAYPLLDDVELFEVYEGKVNYRFQTGDSLRFKDRPIQHQNFLFPVSLNHEESDFYLRVKTTSTLQVPITIWHSKDFWQTDKINTYMDGLFFGGIFIMMMYNLFIFFSIKDNGYLYYVLYMACLLLVQAANRGVGFQFLWPESSLIQNYIIVPSLAGVVAFATLFSFELLDIKSYSEKISKALFLGLILTVVCGLSQLFLSYPYALKLTAVVSILLAGAAIILAFDMWRKGNRLAGYYLTGWSVLIFTFIVYIASVLDFVPRTFLIEYATMFGALAEVVIFSFALADRINIERKIRLRTQETLLETQQEINQKLDVRVKQRTQELEVANSKLQEMSFSDGLTGVKNRRYFDERALAEYKRAYREQCSLSLLLVDIDHFKAINDKFGHQIGDDCLIEVAETLQGTFKRPADAISRYGGEEFAILLPSTNIEGANIVAEKLRKAVESLKMSSPDGKSISLTVSIGVASYVPKLRSGLDNLIKRADQVMYSAKEAGRNCVVSSDRESDN